jgi:hypothetical protein
MASSFIRRFFMYILLVFCMLFGGLIALFSVYLSTSLMSGMSGGGSFIFMVFIAVLALSAGIKLFKHVINIWGDITSISDKDSKDVIPSFVSVFLIGFGGMWALMGISGFVSEVLSYLIGTK